MALPPSDSNPQPSAPLQPPDGGLFSARSRVLEASDVARALRRMAHEIIERNHGLTGVVLIGLVNGGVLLAERLAELLAEIESTRPPVGRLDVSFYRDDLGLRAVMPHGVTAVPVDLTDRVVVLVDDVLFTGRTVRSALDALNDHGRPRAVQLAVMVDRGHRELPIRPDFVGKNLPTAREEQVRVGLDGVEIIRHFNPNPPQPQDPPAPASVAPGTGVEDSNR